MQSPTVGTLRTAQQKRVQMAVYLYLIHFLLSTLHSQQSTKDNQAQFAEVGLFHYASMTSFTECFQAPVVIGQRR